MKRMSTTETLEAPVIVDFTGTDQAENSPLVDQLSEPIIGKWNILVSQTNWEKGVLILDWRNELIAAGLPNTVYSDEAWARRVGNVSPQHVGRLRRVAERFGSTNQHFPGLYWSHFNTALDWDDAELWFEGAVQNGWSVAQMRVQRWDAIGAATGEHKPPDMDVFVAELDEDMYTPQSVPDRIEARTAEIGAANIGVVEGFDASSISVPATDVEPSKKKEQTKKDKAKQVEPSENTAKTGELLLALKGISEFPADLADSLELLKVAILNHKLAGWKSISAEQVCRSLDSLKQLTTAAD